MDEKVNMKKDTAFHKEEDLQEKVEVWEVSLQNIKQDDVLEGETTQVKKEGKASTSKVANKCITHKQ